MEYTNLHSKYRVKFSPDMIDHFGGISGAVSALKKIGVSIKAKTLQKQRERGNIPADMVASLMLASNRMGDPLDPYVYLLERTEE